MDAHIIYILTVVLMFKCILNLGLRAFNVFQVQRYLNPALQLYEVYAICFR